MKQIVLTVILVIVAAAIAGGVGYTLGTQNGLTQAQSIQAEFFRNRGTGQPGQGSNSTAPTGQQAQTGTQGQPGQAGPQGAFGQRGGIAGTVKSVEGNVIQLTGQDGNTVKVQVDDRTVYQKFAPSALSDIRASTRITVTGETSAGVVNARIIQVGASQ
ncbi:MAG: hypothetical protein HY868_07595 [Chloroflexi bacterium]|nr:hypothetical protein [Chloroflexota bacterium]